MTPLERLCERERGRNAAGFDGQEHIGGGQLFGQGSGRTQQGEGIDPVR